MLAPTIINLNHTYEKSDIGVWVLNTDDIPVDKELVKDQQIVHLAPRGVAGNHKHPRTEWFIGIGDLTFIWLDDMGKKHEESMHPDGQIRLFTVPPFLAHAVVNTSTDKAGMLFEMADTKMKGSEQVKVY